MGAQISIIDPWEIKATLYDDRVEEEHSVTDAKKGAQLQVRKIVWERGKRLGAGACGQVFLQSNRENKEEKRAVKRIPLSSTLTDEEYRKELTALQAFSQPKYREKGLFVEFLGWFKDQYDIYIAMEYIELLDLETNLSLGKDGKVPQIEARAITRQILEGLQIMHAESFAHRDLKPQNIMVVRGPPCWRVKLADFGLSKRLTDGSTYNSRIGTQAYMAPEVYGYDNPHSSSIAYTNAVDLWAVGCIVYRLVTGTVPFQTGELRRVCENESKCPSETLGKEVGETCTGFIRLLLSKDPRDRPSAAGALKNTWITAGPVPEMTSCTSSEGASPEEYYRKLFEPQLARAKACMQDQRHTDAINILEPVVEAQKDTLEEKDKVRLGAEMYLAISYIAADRRVRNAIDILEPVVKVLRENFEKYEDRETCESQLAIAYIQEKQPAHAIQILERLVAPQKGTKEKDKPRLSYHFQLGIAYLQNNQIEEAITALEHVVAVQKEILNEEELVRLVPELWLARAYLSNSNVEGAVKLFEHLVEVTERILPQADELRLSGEQGLGVAYHNAGRYRDAVKVLERVVAVQREIFDETDPTRLEFEDLLATAYQSRQRPEEAIKLAAFFY